MISDIFEVDNNDKNIETFPVSNFSDDKSFPENSLYISTSQINGYFGCEGLLLNILDMRVGILG